jgi:hypothetical protein
MRPPLSLAHVDHPGVRARMLDGWSQEFAQRVQLPAIQRGFGRHLTAAGWGAYPVLFEDAVREHDMNWLAHQLNHRAYWVAHASHRTRGRIVSVTVNPADESAKLAHTEFNIAYVTAVLTLASEEGITMCTIVRAGRAAEPRSVCTRMEGAQVSSDVVLAGHRAFDGSHRGSELSIPSGANCHHTVLIPAWIASADPQEYVADGPE